MELTDFELTYKPYGNAAILIEWPKGISPEVHRDILAFEKAIVHQKILEKIVAYHSLTLILKKPWRSFDAWVNILQELYRKRIYQGDQLKKVWQIPVCYDLEFGIDIMEISEKKQLSIRDIVQIHTLPKYLVYFLGFQPGFFYLGGLDERIHFERKSTPRLTIEKGSVAIGGSQTGVYTQNSSGGWNIIGKTPISLFDLTKEQPCFVETGDFIQFVEIDFTAFTEIDKHVKTGVYEPKFTIHD